MQINASKAGAGGCCKHVAAAFYQLIDYKELAVKSVPSDKTCTDILQKWHVPGEKANDEAILFSNLIFEKADAEKDKNCSRKRPVVSGKRKFCATPLFAHETNTEKMKKLSKDLHDLGQALQLSVTLEGNDFKPCDFFKTSVTEVNEPAVSVANNIEERECINNIFQKMDDFVDTSVLSDAQKVFTDMHLNISTMELRSIEMDTITQSENNLWFEHRRKRLTASNFGIVMNRRSGTPSDSILNRFYKTVELYFKSL